MYRTYEDNYNMNCDEFCSKKRNRCENNCYVPSCINNQVILRGPTGPAVLPGPMGSQGFIGPTGPPRGQVASVVY